MFVNFIYVNRRIKNFNHQMNNNVTKFIHESETKCENENFIRLSEFIQQTAKFQNSSKMKLNRRHCHTKHDCRNIFIKYQSFAYSKLQISHYQKNFKNFASIFSFKFFLLFISSNSIYLFFCFETRHVDKIKIV